MIVSFSIDFTPIYCVIGETDNDILLYYLSTVFGVFHPNATSLD